MLLRHIVTLIFLTFAISCAELPKERVSGSQTDVLPALLSSDSEIDSNNLQDFFSVSGNSITNCLPSQHIVYKRKNYSGKNNTEYIKAGKFIYAGTRTFVNYNIYFISVPFVKSAHKLITFGKLII